MFALEILLANSFTELTEDGEERVRVRDGFLLLNLKVEIRHKFLSKNC